MKGVMGGVIGCDAEEFSFATADLAGIEVSGQTRMLKGFAERTKESWVVLTGLGSEEAVKGFGCQLGVGLCPRGGLKVVWAPAAVFLRGF